jgi:hypothetical protein
MQRYFASFVLFSGCLFVSCAGYAQQSFGDRTETPAIDFASIVFPITTIKFYGPAVAGWMGTGFCLDPECRFVGTNYHVAVEAKSKRIGGQKIAQQYLATSSGDAEAILNVSAGSGAPVKFAPGRDLAIFKLAHPLPHRRGMPFRMDDLAIGEEVDIYSYPKENTSPIRKLLKFHAKFAGETATGLLAFEYELTDGKTLRPGASGGIVMDSSGQIAGVLSSIAADGEAVALAVPVHSLVDFVSRELPCLAQSIFPSVSEVSEVSADFYPPFVPVLHMEKLERRPQEAATIRALRGKAQAMADGMNDLIAIQTFAWGSGNKAMAQEAYEVRLVDGHERFRSYPDGKKELREVSYPPPLNNAVKTEQAWSGMPHLIALEYGLKMQQAPDVVVAGRSVKVFQYRSNAEDDACLFRNDLDWGFLAVHKMLSVDCYGEVWTDESLNILRISQHLELPGKWKDYQVVMTYGWLQKEGLPARIVPVSISTQANYKGKVYWCRGRFMNYQLFRSQGRLIMEKFDRSQLLTAPSVQ